MPVVVDTNVLASAMAFPASVPRRAFDKALDQGRVLLSLPVLTEWHEVFGRFKWDQYVPRAKRMRFLLELIRVGEWVEITESISACRDPKDDRFLELRSAVKLTLSSPATRICWRCTRFETWQL